jgi:hypothetical protein
MKKFIFFLLAVISYASTEIYPFILKLNYKEYIHSKVVDKDSSKLGDIIGIGIKYSNKNFFDYYISGEISGGDSYYSGADWNGNKIKLKQSGFSLLNLEGGIGKYLYFFIGYRHWNRGKSKNIGDYDELYYWSYIGFKYSCKFDFNKVVFYPEAGYKMAIDPKMKVKMGNEPILDLGNTTAGFVELPFYFKYNKFYIKVFYRFEYWCIEKSKNAILVLDNYRYEIFEPESITKNQYFGIGINFNF